MSSESEYEKEKDDNKCDNILSGRTSRRKTSKAWEYFSILDSDAHVARCNICYQKLSYRASVSNLIKHIRRKHDATLDFGNGGDQIRLNEDTKPDKMSKLIISEDGQIYEIEESHEQEDEKNTDSLEMDAVYLDEYADDLKQEVKSKVKKRKLQSSRVFNNRNSMVRVPEKVSVPKPSQLDLFGTYLVSLLKELPNRESKRLQAEFVKAAIEAHINTMETTDTNIPVSEGDTTLGVADSGKE